MEILKEVGSFSLDLVSFQKKLSLRMSGEDRPVQIVKIDEESKTQDEDFRDKPICIITVAGH